MRIFKRLSVVCAIVFCAGFISARADDNAAQAAARAALMNALNGESTQISTNAPTPSVPESEQPMPTLTTNQIPQVEITNEIAPPVINQVAQPATTNEVPQVAQPEIAVTNAPMPANLTAPAPTVAPTPMPEIPQTAPPPAPTNFSGKNLGFQPIVAPPLPISPQKEAQLQALLARYKANQITPAQYQAERARILADP